jgi:hypothetical protein
MSIQFVLLDGQHSQFDHQTKEIQELVKNDTQWQSGSSIFKKLFDTYPEVLTNPAKYLGPNFQAVLDFWFYLDSLSEQEQVEISYRIHDLRLDHQSFLLAIDAALDGPTEVISRVYYTIAGQAIKNAIGFDSPLFLYATGELIANLENRVFFPLAMIKFCNHSRP